MMKVFREHLRCSIGSMALVLLCLHLPLSAVSQLRQFQKAPSINLPVLHEEATHISLESLQGKPAILVFGELYNQNTRDALKELSKVLSSAGMNEKDLRVCLIVTKSPDEGLLAEIQKNDSLNLLVLHDRTRETFGAFSVIVLPSFVVLDSQGNISLAMSGYPLTFSDMMTDAILFATGKLTQEQYLASGESNYEIQPVEENQIRATRLAGLARQLFRRGYADLALENYEKALKLDPDYQAGLIGMARCLIKLNRLGQAEQPLNRVLKTTPENLQANLAMAYIEILRGGKEMPSAQQRLDRILAHNPYDPEAHYLMGLVFESQSEKDKAIEQFKQAAELLIEIKLQR